jgi:ribosomal protein L37E
MTKSICPECGEKSLLSSMREDFCTECGYSERYEDAYAKEDPGGDFPDAEKFR